MFRSIAVAALAALSLFPALASAAEPAALASAAEPAARSSAAEPAARSSAAQPAARSSAAEPAAISSAAEPAAISSAAEPAAISSAAEPAALDKDAARKLYELGYPTDNTLAVQRWRSDNRLSASGAMTAAERQTLMAQAAPELVTAMTGNPFTGMGLALRHTRREDAEKEAIRFCKAQGGGSGCVAPMIVRAEQCVVLVGYSAKIDRRPHHRVTTAISTDVKLATERGIEACQTGASHPQLCRVLVKFCGDGSHFEIEGKGGSS